MKSNTKISKQLQRKLNPELVKTILVCKKNKEWKKVAEILTRPTREKIIINLDKINSETKEGDTVIVPGKVLSQGEIDKKIRIAALSFSEKAQEKLKKTKSEVVSILDEIKINKNAQGIKVIGVKNE